MMHALVKPSVALFAVLLVPVPVLAQARPAGDAPVAPASAGSTAMGDSGLWFVSAAEVLPANAWNGGFVAASEHRGQDGLKMSYGALSAARGIGGRTEVFGAWQLTTAVAGRRGSGDLLAGAKYNLLSARTGAPVAVAARAVLKVPTGNDDIGASSGRADLLTELIASRQFGRAEVTGSGGLVLRGNPRGVEQPNGIRSGVGVAVMAHRAVRLLTEVHGEHYRGSTTGARLASPFDTPTTAAIGVSWTVADRLGATAGLTRALGTRDDARGVGVAVRVGYHPGTRRASPVTAPMPPPAPASTAGTPPPPPPAAAASNGPGAGSGVDHSMLILDDVHFDLDRHTLRADAFAILDRAVAAMQADPTLRLQLDGHTCEIGTTEYNLALGRRRAMAVRDYLVSRGIAADRLQTTSYGEERPKHDMHTEESRALNRRVELHTVAPRSNR